MDILIAGGVRKWRGEGAHEVRAVHQDGLVEKRQWGAAAGQFAEQMQADVARAGAVSDKRHVRRVAVIVARLILNVVECCYPENTIEISSMKIKNNLDT